MLFTKLREVNLDQMVELSQKQSKKIRPKKVVKLKPQKLVVRNHQSHFLPVTKNMYDYMPDLSRIDEESESKSIFSLLRKPITPDEKKLQIQNQIA